MERIKVEVHKDCGKTTPMEILADMGYNANEYKHFRKDGKVYKFVSWDHYNSYVYSITLQQIA